MFPKIAQIDYIIDKFLFHYYKPHLKIRTATKRFLTERSGILAGLQN